MSVVNCPSLMESISGPEITTNGILARKKRSTTPRRPRTDSHFLSSNYNFSPNNQCTPYIQKTRKLNEAFGDADALNTNGCQNKVKKVKLKLGGVTRTIHANISADFALQLPKIKQENIDTRKSSHGAPRKDFSKNGSGSREENLRCESVRKSKRIPKRRVLETGFSDDDEDAEIRFLGRFSSCKVATLSEYEVDEGKRSEKVLKSTKRDRKSCIDHVDHGKSSTPGRHQRSRNPHEDGDYIEEVEPISDNELNIEKKALRKDLAKDELSGLGEALIDTQDGLLPAVRKKQKEKLSDVEQQLKKVEAAQRRRLYSEKAAKEAEAEAIRKILGQDSARKKKEDKMKKQQEERAQEKAANGFTLAPSTIRWVTGPTGTLVTFAYDIGLPSIFSSTPVSYPQPREKCAGPNCTNSYRYRDSKSKLPLCSLLCYRAIHEEMKQVTAC